PPHRQKLPRKVGALRAGDRAPGIPEQGDCGECASFLEDPMDSRSRLPVLIGAVAAALLASCARGEGIIDDGQLQVGSPASGAFSAVNSTGWATATWPQGAAFVSGEGSNLRVGVYAAHATRVLLEIYATATGSSAQYDYVMAKGSDGIWRAELASVPGK